MIDVKKLITGFLILATAATCSGIILSLVSNLPTQPKIVPEATITPDASGTLAANAFLPVEPTNTSDQYVATATLAASSSDPNNLTDVLATAFVNGVADANPNGPVSDNGNSVIAHPDETAIATQVASVPALANFVPPDWTVEANSQPIKTVSGSSAQDISNYSQSLSDIVNTGLVASNVESIVNSQNSDPSQISFVMSQLQQTLSNTLSLPTPQPLVGFQKSLVAVMVYEKNELQLAENVGADPVKTALILQNEQPQYDAAVQNLQTQIKKASTLNGFSFGVGPETSESGALSFFNTALGIPTAHAQWLTFDAANFSQWLESFVKNIILQILKNTLTALIQKKVLAWVQGSGAPRFITNWGTTLVNSYEQSALNALNSQISCGVFPAYIPKIKVTLGSFYQPGTNNACANQFQAALGANTLQQFYNNFRNGGFVAFGASTLPSGNPYGGIFFNAQIVGNTAQNAQQATLAKTTSAQGQKGDEVCSDQSNPNNGEHTVCENPDGPDYTINSASACADGSTPDLTGTCKNGLPPALPETCGTGDTPVVYANQGTCSDGSEPTVTTPGVYTGFAFSSAVDASPKLVTAANDIVGLLNSLLGSLLNSLASLAVNSATGAINSGLNPSGGGVVSIPPSTITGGGSTSTIPVVALSCNPNTQTVSSTFPASIGAVGGTSDANGNAPTYTWTSSDGQTGNGYIFSPTYNIPGVYIITITDSALDKPATCKVTAQ